MNNTINLNAYKITPVPGFQDLINFGSNNQEAILATSSSNPASAGEAVTLQLTSNGLPTVEPMLDATKVPWGFVVFSQRQSTYQPGQTMTIARSGSVLYLKAGANIPAGSACEYNPTNKTIIVHPADGTNAICGYAMDMASAAGDLIRMTVSYDTDND